MEKQMDHKMEKKQKERGVVLSQEELQADIYSMWVHLPKTAPQAVCGQFFSLFTGDDSRLLPRPISICEIDRERGAIRFVYRVTGERAGTKRLSLLKEGDPIDTLGPFGNGFRPEEARGKHVLLVGGGIGIPPMIELAKEIGSTAKTMTYVMGYRNAPLFLADDFPKYGQLCAATEDGSAGVKGNVLDVIRQRQRAGEPLPDIIYSCGPTPMLRALIGFADEYRIPCYVSLEERMACGIGACLACVCRTRHTDAHTHVNNARICKEGPVFLSTEVEL